MYSLFLCVAWISGSYAAEVEKLGNWIVITGDIDSGDFSKFTSIFSTAVAAGSKTEDFPTGVALYSNGGKTLEALNIGRGIRKMRLRTTGPTSKLGNKSLSFCPPGLGGSNEQTYFDSSTGKGSLSCVCNSACALIWSAGILRNGKAGFHRPHFPKVSIDNFDSFEANSRRARQMVEHYMVEMDIPEATVVATAKSGKNELYHIDARDGFARTPTFDNLAVEECGWIGDVTSIEAKLRHLEEDEALFNSHSNGKDKILDVFGSLAACHVSLQERLAQIAVSKLRTFVEELERGNRDINGEALEKKIQSYLASPIIAD